MASTGVDLTSWGLLLLFLGASALAQGCSQAEIDNCTEPMAEFGLKGLAIFPPLEYNIRNDMCRRVPGVQTCLLDLRQSCDVFQSRFIDGQNSAYEYICDDNAFYIFWENTACFARPEILTISTRCNTTYQQRIQDNVASTHYTSNIDIAKKQCSDIRSYVFCLDDGLRDLCGDDAANWQHEVNVRGLTPMLQELGEPPGCDLNRPRFTPGEIAGIVIGSLLGLCLIIFIIYLLTCNVKRYRKRHKILEVSADDVIRS